MQLVINFAQRQVVPRALYQQLLLHCQSHCWCHMHYQWVLGHCQCYMYSIQLCKLSRVISALRYYSLFLWDHKRHFVKLYPLSLGYLLIYPPQIATVMKLISFCSKYNPVSHTKSLGESQEWNMVFQRNIWSRVKAFKKIYGFAHFGYRRYILHLMINRTHNLGNL